VVLCGRNKRLYKRLRAKSSMIARDWISDIPMLLTAVDGVVQNARRLRQPGGARRGQAPP
jgi:hypothetical protein